MIFEMSSSLKSSIPHAIIKNIIINYNMSSSSTSTMPTPSGMPSMPSPSSTPSTISNPSPSNMPSMPSPSGMPGAPPPAMKGGKRRSGTKKHSRAKHHSRNMSGGASMPAVGSKASVYHGHAKHTSGGLTRKDLMKTKHGRIVSRRKHALGKKAIRRLRKAGYKAKKGTFKLFKRK